MSGFLHNPAFATSDTVKYTYDESGNRLTKEENGIKIQIQENTKERKKIHLLKNNIT